MVTQPIQRTAATSHRTLLLIIVWIGTLLASPLLEILWREIFAGDVSVFESRVLSLLILFVLSLVWQLLGPLRGYVGLLLMLTVVLEGLSPLIAQSTLWQGWFDANDTA